MTDLRKHAPEASRSPLGIMGVISLLLGILFLLGYALLSPQNVEVATEVELNRQVFLRLAGSFLLLMGVGVLLFHVARDPHLATGADEGLRAKLADASLGYRILLLPRVLLSHRRAQGFFTHTVQVLLAIALYLLANYLFARHELWRTDVTSGRVFTLSEESVKLVGEVQAPVRLLTVLPEGGLPGDNLRELKLLVEQYHEANPRILGEFFDTLTVSDPLERERQLRALGVSGELSNESLLGVVVQIGRPGADPFEVERSKRVGIPDIWQADPSDRRGVRQSFNGERAISTAIMELLDDKKPVLYFLEGHGEPSIGDMDRHGLAYLVERLRERNFETKTLNLLKAERVAVPEDADLLVVAGPRSPLTPDEVAAIGAYLQGGGDMIFLAEPRYETATASQSVEWIDTGLETLVRDRYGILCLDRIVTVRVEDRSRRTVLTADLQGALEYSYRHPITQALPQQRARLLLARPLKRLPVLNCVTEELLTSVKGREQSYVGLSHPDSSDRSQAGPFALAMAAEAHDSTGKTGPKLPSRVVVVGDLDFAAAGILSQRSYNNLELLLNSIEWCVERESRIVGKRKVRVRSALVMTDEQIARVSLLAFLGLPALAIALGVLAWAIRRRNS